MNNLPDRLTSLILNWQMSGEGYRQILDECSTVILEYPKKHYRWEHDLCADFYIFFYPRLAKLIKSYDYNGMSFYAILNNTIAWQLRTFYRRNSITAQKKKCIENYSIYTFRDRWVEDFSEEISLTEKAIKKLQISENGTIANKKLAQKLLMLVLKNTLFIKEGKIDKISEILGLERQWLINAMRMLKHKCEDRICRFNEYKYRANKAYMDLWQVQKELNNCVDVLAEQKLLKKQKKLRLRFKSAIYRKNSVHYSPTNAEVAEVLGIPKGTVDSGLFYFKRLFSDEVK